MPIYTVRAPPAVVLGIVPCTWLFVNGNVRQFGLAGMGQAEPVRPIGMPQTWPAKPFGNCANCCMQFRPLTPPYGFYAFPKTVTPHRDPCT